MRVRELTIDEIRAFREEGVAFLPALADKVTVAALRAAAERRAAAPSAHSDELSREGRFLSDQFLYDDIKEFRDFVFNTRIAENAGRAMGACRVRLYFDHLFVCAPQTPTDYYWHQDLPYWPLEGSEICSFWLSLVGSQGDGDFSAQGLPEPPAFHEAPDKYEILSWDYRAGDAVLFNARIMHSSGGNSSTDIERIAYSTRWIGEDARFKAKPGWQDPLLLPDGDEPHKDGQPLESRKFPEAWSTAD
jgi:ectoine hydroxylase-related dioxygenase (phytanoyl-CoA dioxygenase family)